MLIIQIALFSRDQKWRQQFQDYGLEWLDAIGGYFEILVHQVIGHDVWRAVDVNITRSQLRTLRRKRERLIPRGPIGGKAASVPSLTPSLHSAFDTVVPSTSAPSKVGFFYHSYKNFVKSFEFYRPVWGEQRPSSVTELASGCNIDVE